MSSACLHKQIERIDEIDDSGDVRITRCKDCHKDIKRERLTTDEDGSSVVQPEPRKRARPPENPLIAEEQGTAEVNAALPTAYQMAEYADFIREERIGKQSRALAKRALDQCKEKVLDGKHDFLIPEGEDIAGEIITAAVKELRDRGYKITKAPVPGEGLWLKISWPTKSKPPRKPKARKTPPVEEKTPEKPVAKKPGRKPRHKKVKKEAEETEMTFTFSKPNLPSS